MSRAWGRHGIRVVALVFVTGLLLTAVPGTTAAETRSGGTVIVAENETVHQLTAVAGTVVVRGTITGDLTAYAGAVIVHGNVTGDVHATAGTVRIGGTIGGNVSASGGSIFVDRNAVITGTLEATGGTLTVSGVVGGDAKLGGGSITLDSTAVIGGDIEYAIGEDGEFTNEATVEGDVEERDDLTVGWVGLPESVEWTVGVYGFLVNLLLGTVLLLVFPGPSRRIAEAVIDEPLRIGGVGLLALVGIPIILVLLFITIIGIPLALAGVVLYLLAIWVGGVYGRFAVGSWIVSLTGADNRWAGLLLGMALVAILVRLPSVGGLFQLTVLLLGLGAMSMSVYRWFRNRRGPDAVRGRPHDTVDVPDPAP